MGRDLIMGDLHGAHKALEQCLARCGFDTVNDRLITLGDICDGWPYVYECVEILLTLNTVNMIGNHDEWFRFWLEHGVHPDSWRQGGRGTAESYLRHTALVNGIQPSWDYSGGFSTNLNPDDIPATHRNFFMQQLPYYKDKKNRLFVHGGFYRFQTLASQNSTNPHVFWWDRELWNEALSVHDGEKLTFKEEFSEIFIGHTETINWTRFKRAPNSLVLLPTRDTDCPPMKADIVYNLDTGAGSTGKLTIMDVDTHEYWQSDCVNDFYGDYKPRA